MGGKRQSTHQKKKVGRKIRESKRDINKAAKVMKSSGMKQRSKKSREAAKLALRISNAHPDKEMVLKRLLAGRETARVERAERRQVSRKESKKAAGGDVDGSGSDDEDAEVIPRSEMLTAKQVKHRDKEQRRIDEAAVVKQASRQHLLIPPGENVGSFSLQFDKVVSALRKEVGCFMVVLDTRCAVQSMPWTMLDEIIADTAQWRTEIAAEEKAAKKGAAALVPSSSVVLRSVVFVLAKTDIVPLDVTANTFSLVAEALAARYGEHVMAPAAKKGKAAGAAPPVMFTCVPFSTLIDNTVPFLTKTLRKIQADYFSAFNFNDEANNMKNKLAVCVVGLPCCGKSSVVRSVHTAGSDAAVAVIPCRSIRTVIPFNPEEINADADDKAQLEKRMNKIVLPGAKSITFITIADDEKLKRAPMVCGDVVFHSMSSIEKLELPESVGIMLAEKFVDNSALCQAFSLPIATTPLQFVKHLGRSIIRDKGFQPTSMFSGAGGSLTASALGSSVAQGAIYMTSQRMIRVRAKRSDGRNALRVGARQFLKEFFMGKNLVWAVKRTEDEEEEGDEPKKKPTAAQAKAKADAAAASINVFTPIFVPKQVAAAVGDDLAANPGAVVLLSMQHAMKDYAALLPKFALEIEPVAVTVGSSEEVAAEEEADSEDDELVDEEEEDEEEDDEEMSSEDDGEEEEAEEDDE
jgi:hypothetical protein